MSNPQGSDLAKMLLRNDMNVGLCAVSNISDNHAIGSPFSDYTPIIRRVQSYNEQVFLDDNGSAWRYAVPIKISRLQQSDL